MNVQTLTRDGLKISFINEEEFEIIYKDIFVLKEYDFKTNNPKPFILDCGSHIGLSVLYFKKIYPLSKIIAFEPNPITFSLLEKNIHQNNIQNVILINHALASTKGTINFYISMDEDAPWTWGDSAVMNKWATKENTRTIQIPSVQLSEYINQEIDLLKLDVEGLEEQILNEIGSKIEKVKELFMEIHGSSTNPDNNSERILSYLRDHKLRYTIKQEGKLIEEKEINKTDPYWLVIHAQS